MFRDTFFARKTFNNSAIKNQSLIDRATDVIIEEVEDNEKNILLHLPNLLAISKATETNRKQVLGITAPYIEEPEEDQDNLLTFEILPPRRADEEG